MAISACQLLFSDFRNYFGIAPTLPHASLRFPSRQRKNAPKTEKGDALHPLFDLVETAGLEPKFAPFLLIRLSLLGANSGKSPICELLAAYVPSNRKRGCVASPFRFGGNSRARTCDLTDVNRAL